MATKSLGKTLNKKKVGEGKLASSDTPKSHSNKINVGDFPGGAVVKNPPANAGDMGLILGPGRSHMPRSN